RNLWVASGDDVRRFGVKTAADASSILGATLVVAGVLEHHGEQVRLTLRLIDPVHGRDLDSRSIRGQASHLEDFSALTAHELAALVGVSPAPLGAAGTRKSGSAYENYLAGQGSLHTFEGPPAVASAISSFQKALEMDPSFSQAVSGLA